MEFKKGNKLWERRSKHGRDKLFASPKLLWEAFASYCQWSEDNPIVTYKPMVVDKEIEEAVEKKALPLTLMGFCIFIGCSESYFRTFKCDKNKCTPDFLAVIEQIQDVCRTQKFNGAAAGIFNANIISRDLGLIDKQASEVLNYNTDITPEEAKAISKGLEEEF